MEEDEQVERKRQAAVKLAVERGLHMQDQAEESVSESKQETPIVEDIPAPPSPEVSQPRPTKGSTASNAEAAGTTESPKDPPNEGFVPARLPHFG